MTALGITTAKPSFAEDSHYIPRAAGRAFDAIAEKYDDLFTRSTLGRLQRRVVWDAIAQTFAPGGSILELNCGTGEDAFFLARSGMRVLACDASERMIAVARQRKQTEHPGANVEFRALPTESLDLIGNTCQFDGVLSNFSGLNCVDDLPAVARALALLVKAGGRALLCLSSRICVCEMLWYLAHGNARKAFRRLSGQTVAHLEGVEVPVFYPSPGAIRSAFQPAFRLRKMQAVGLAIPPSYVESWATDHPRTLATLQKMDRALRDLPLLANLGDHILFDFERVTP